ncbi:MAG: hypothetical protein MJZ57_05995 [Bacteroidales bacterium]|nr:hypothetical protein [Bacteroidales bacterium]
MNTLLENCQPFIQLGKRLQEPDTLASLESSIRIQYPQNPWFTPYFVKNALSFIAKALEESAILAFATQYGKQPLVFNQHKKVAVISSGKVPLEDFFDFFHVLVSGNDYLGKLSSTNQHLLPAIAQCLTDIEPSWAERIQFAPKLSHFDAVIADSTEDNHETLTKYFNHLPNIIRSSTHSVAVLTGQETPDELIALANDIYLYFGMSRRSVTKLIVPEQYDFVPLLRTLNDVSKPIADHHQYLNNLDYQKAVRLINKLYYMDSGTFLLLENESYTPPVSAIYYQYYNTLEQVESILQRDSDQLECIIAHSKLNCTCNPFGTTHQRKVSDFTHHIDTIQFLGTLS